jgi:hypothetical protein
MLIRHRVSRFQNRVYETIGSIFFPELDVLIPKKNNILCVLDNDKRKLLIPAHNIITNAGDTYYAQKACGESPTNTFANLYLASNDWSATHPQKTTHAGNLSGTAISGTSKAVSATYPKTNDGDADNTGAGVDIITWLFSYTKADFNATGIDAGAIAASGVTFGSGSSPILTGFTLTSFDKTANDTLKVFVNHEVLGV